MSNWKSRMFTGLLTVVLMVIFLLPIASASGFSTTERENLYSNAIAELESYMIFASNDSGTLYTIAATLDSLGNYQQSKFLRMYVLAFAKIIDGEFDVDLELYLDVICHSEDFEKFLADTGSIGTVTQLQHYKKARECELNGNATGATAAYQECIGFYDAADRYIRLSDSLRQGQYDLAMQKLNADDYAGAYCLFVQLGMYQDSDQMATSIERLLGYIPQNELDNLQPVTGVKASKVSDTSISIQWNPSAHAEEYLVYYKESSKETWTDSKKTSSTAYETTGLREGVAYDFKVIASIGNGSIQAKEALLTGQATAMLTPTPTEPLTAPPSPEPTLTPTPEIKELIPVLSQVYPGISTKLKKRNDRWISKFGPGDDFAEGSGGYKTDSSHSNSLTVFYGENDWVLADIVYSSAFERYAYLPLRSLASTDGVPQITELEFYPGTLIEKTIPRWGPDDHFKENSDCTVDARTDVKVFFQENGYAFAEFTCAQGKVRMWIPMNHVSFD